MEEKQPEGLKYWTDLAEKEGNIALAFEGIIQSSEFGAREEKFSDAICTAFSNRRVDLNKNVPLCQARLFSNGIDPFKLEDLVPSICSAEQRIEVAAACNDMDAVPRVSGAGQVLLLQDGTRVQIMHNGLKSWQMGTTVNG